MITITTMTSTINNWGQTEITKDVDEIRDYLTDHSYWTDDEYFTDENGNSYTLDDLIQKMVKVGDEIFFVESDK